VDLTFLQGEVYVSATGGCVNSPLGGTVFTADFPVALSVFQAGDSLFMNPVVTPAQWYLNGNPIPNATDTFYIPQLNGSYSVSVIDSNGCHAVSPPYIFVNLGWTDLNSIPVSVYPQPFDEQLTLSMPEITSATRMEITDVTGRRVYSTTIFAAENLINTSTWKPGVYVLKLQDDKGRHSQTRILKIGTTE
jgi:hypothetical protein